MRSLLALVAVVGALLGAERLLRRSGHYRRQASLCAVFELQHQDYADTAMDEGQWEGLSIEEKKEVARLSLIESRRYGSLKNIYRRVVWRPWESLPPGTPASVNAWDLWSLSAPEIEGMVSGWKKA